jgi:hypothetical protein
MYCTNCGTSVPEDIKFCTNCGKELHRKRKPPKETNHSVMSHTQAEDKEKPVTEYSEPDRKVKRDPANWLSWLFITLGIVLSTFSGDNPSPFFTWILAFLAGAYTYYIYKGGTIVIVFIWLKLLVKLFTVGYKKELYANQPKSNAWMIWVFLLQ